MPSAETGALGLGLGPVSVAGAFGLGVPSIVSGIIGPGAPKIATGFEPEAPGQVGAAIDMARRVAAFREAIEFAARFRDPNRVLAALPPTSPGIPQPPQPRDPFQLTPIDIIRGGIRITGQILDLLRGGGGGRGGQGIPGRAPPFPGSFSGPPSPEEAAIRELMSRLRRCETTLQAVRGPPQTTAVPETAVPSPPGAVGFTCPTVTHVCCQTCHCEEEDDGLYLD